MTETRKLAAILAADVVGYSRLVGADEDRTLARLRSLRSDLIDPTVTAHEGRVVKRTGDGVIVEFRSVVESVRCAIGLLNGMIERNAGLPSDQRIEFRVGIHLGDVVEESDGDLMGDGVNIAARLEGIANPGSIFLSEDAYRQVRARLDVAVDHIGAKKLKNIGEPVHVYSVQVGNPVPKAGAVRRKQLVPALAAVFVAAAAAWFFFGGNPTTTAESPAPTPASSFGPTVAVLAFANTSGDVDNDAPALRIGQKAADHLGKYTLLRTIGSSGGAAISAADSIEAGQALGADYVVTGNVESGAGDLRVTFRLDDMHSGARVWSQTLSPVLEDEEPGTREEEVAGRAGALMNTAILHAEAERARRKSDGELTTYDCVVLGLLVSPATAAHLRDCLEAAAQREPANADVWIALANVVRMQRFYGWGLPPEEAAIEKRDRLADRQLQAALRAVDLDPHGTGAQAQLAYSYYAKCQPDRFRTEVHKTAALNPYDAAHLGRLGYNLAFIGFWDEGTALAERAIKLMGAAANPYFWWAAAKRSWFRGEYEEAYKGFQRAYVEGLWISHLDLAYTLPFLDRIDEAKANVATLLKLNPSMTIREADAFYKLVCFQPAYREKMVGALRLAGLPE